MINETELQEMVIRPLTKKQLAASYRVSCKVITGWLQAYSDQLERKHTNYYSLEQMFFIYKKFGYPGSGFTDMPEL